MSCLGATLVKQAVYALTMKLRSCATFTHEPCQDLTVAALSGPKSVPQGNFNRVKLISYYLTDCFEAECTSYQIKYKRPKVFTFGFFIKDKKL